MGNKKNGSGSKETNGNVTNYDSLSDKEENVMKCGYGKCTPNWLQAFNSSKALLAAVSWFAFVQNLVVNGIVFVNITTIERRFELSSKQAALLPVSYELSAGFCALIFGFLGIFMHIGKILTFGAFCMSVGSFVCFLPHLLAGSYQLGSLPSEQCDITGDSVVECTQGPAGSSYVYLFVIGQILHGVGGGAIFTLGTPYMDENIRTENTPLYIGLMQMFAMFGPAAGFMAGGLLLTNYVDFLRVDMNEITLTPSDPRWVGAWWIAYLVTSSAGLTVAFFMACFPKQLAKSKELKKTRKSLAYKGHGESIVTDSEEGMRQLLKTQWGFLKMLAMNPVWVLLTVCTTVETGCVIGFATFMPKMLQFQFSLTSTKAALLSGAIFIPGAAGGMLVGGLIPKWTKSEVRGLLGQCLICSIACLALSFTFLIRCESPAIAGITRPYFPSSNVSEFSLTHACNANCSCTTISYDPICGANGLQYFSICHAGCTTSTLADGTPVHTDCSCITNSSGGSLFYPDMPHLNSSHQATDGPCQSDCGLLYLFLPLFFLIILMNFLSVPANQASTLRCVPDKQRSFAFGVQDFFLRYCGNVLGPIILGTVFDMSCSLWQEDCGSRGSCWVYDGSMLALGFLGLCFVVKVISTLSYILAIVLYHPPPPARKSDEHSTEKNVDDFLLTPLHKEDNGCEESSGSPNGVSGHMAAHA